MTTKLFSELGISAEILKAIDKLGFEQASPIQAEAIPILMQGKDVVGQSQTGSGKTVAFAVPAVEKVDPHSRDTEVLILCPTRELAVQVAEEVHKLTLFKRGIHALPIYGGQSYDRQLYGLKQGAQIVIGTPGRVMDHMQRGTLRLDKLKMVILDEADVMLNMGFRDDIEFILQDTPADRQTVFFCATMPKPILELIQRYAREPQNIRIEQKTMTVQAVDQVYYEVDRRFKIETLTRLIDLHDLKLGIIFCNTKRMVDDLVDHLNVQGYSADRLHGDMTQAMRDRVMNKFRKSGLEFLVATDVAARGIDVDDVQVVFNYDLPYDVEDYVHRIGRTGRAGRSGMAISFVAGRELFQVHHIERYINMKIRRGRVPSAEEVEAARTNVFIGKLRGVLQEGEFKSQDQLIEPLLEEGFSSTDIVSALIHMLQMGETIPGGRPPGREEQEGRPPRRDDRGWDDRRERGGDRGFRNEREDRWRGRDDRRDDFHREERFDRRREYARPYEKREVEPIVDARKIVVPKVVTPPKRAAEAAPSAPTAPSAPVSVTPAVPAPVPVAAPAPKPEKPTTDVLTPKPPKRLEKKVVEPVKPAPAPRRKTPENQTSLHINAGFEMGVTAQDVVGVIQGETGLGVQAIGAVDVRERHLFVNVASEHVNAILSKLNRTQIKGRKIKVKVA